MFHADAVVYHARERVHEEKPTMTALVIGRMESVVSSAVAVLREEGFEAVGVTTDGDAVARINTGKITALVIGGGVGWGSRRLLRKAAEAHGTAVIQGAMGGGSFADYVRGQIVPGLRAAGA
jgi:thiamine pyrophosphate-dependent acetolactate synthase large subunit-like protein